MLEQLTFWADSWSSKPTKPNPRHLPLSSVITCENTYTQYLFNYSPFLHNTTYKINSALHPSWVVKSSTSFAGVKMGMSPLPGSKWYCAIPWHGSFHGGETGCKLLYSIKFYLLYGKVEPAFHRQDELPANKPRQSIKKPKHKCSKVKSPTAPNPF